MVSEEKKVLKEMSPEEVIEEIKASRTSWTRWSRVSYRKEMGTNKSIQRKTKICSM